MEINYKDDPCCEGTQSCGINVCVNITIVQGRVEPPRNSASCTRIEERRPCPTGIRKGFVEEVALELSFEGKMEFSWVLEK